MMDILDVGANPSFDNRITKIETHTYNPYANTKFDNSDEIRIPIQQQDLYILPSESYLYIEGQLKLIEDRPVDVTDDPSPDNNFVAYLFDEIRYEIDGVEIDRCRNPGTTTTLKNYATLSAERSGRLASASWLIGGGGNVGLNPFNYCVPLNMLLGFCDDYKRIVINSRHELILIRARSDVNAIRGPDTLKPKVQIHKLQWKMPHVNLEELNKLALLRILESGRSIAMSFRTWDLYEYPLLQETTKHSWTVKATSSTEKPRYVIFALQTDRKNKYTGRATTFDHCKLQNVRLYLNSEMYPYDDLHLDFDKSKFTLLYDMYARFRKSYYGSGEPMMNTDSFSSFGPIITIDCSRQNDAIKSGTVDVRLEFECKENIPKNTTAYCMIIHDLIVEYNPLTSIVRKIV